MSYARTQDNEQKLRKEIEELTKAAVNADELDDKEFGKNFDGNKIPDELCSAGEEAETTPGTRARLAHAFR